MGLRPEHPPDDPVFGLLRPQIAVKAEEGPQDALRLPGWGGRRDGVIRFLGAGPVLPRPLGAARRPESVKIRRHPAAQIRRDNPDPVRDHLQVVLRPHREGPLEQDIPRVEPRLHFVQGDAALSQSPEDGHRHGPRPPARRQEGGVDIHDGKAVVHRHPVEVTRAEDRLTSGRLQAVDVAQPDGPLGERDAPLPGKAPQFPVELKLVVRGKAEQLQHGAPALLQRLQTGQQDVISQIRDPHWHFSPGQGAAFPSLPRFFSGWGAHTRTTRVLNPAYRR